MGIKILIGDTTIESKKFTNLIFIESLRGEEKFCRYGRSQSIQTFSKFLILIYTCGDGFEIGSFNLVNAVLFGWTAGWVGG